MVLFFTTASATCPDLDALLDDTEAHLGDIRMEQVEQGLETIENSLGCGAPATPEQLARMWQLTGVAAVVQNDETTAVDAFQALHRISPDSYQDRWGSKAREAFEKAEALSRLHATLSLTPELGGNQAFLDGVPIPDETPTTAGLHVVQIASPSREVLFSEVLFLNTNQDRLLDTGIPAYRPPRQSSSSNSKSVRGPGWLVVGITALAAGTGAGAFTAAQNERVRKAPDFTSLDRRALVQRTGAGVTYGLLGVGTLSTGFFLARQF